MTICIDFDGTCVTHEFPKVGKDIGATPVLKKLVANGHRLILFTMRSNQQEGITTPNSLGWNNPPNIVLETNVLDDAVNWFKSNDIPLFGINVNPTQTSWTKSPKAYGQLYIDDAALGCPLLYNSEISDLPFVDWIKVEGILKDKKIVY
jgi:hypothetical protein